MIVKMQKITLLCMQNDVPATLNALRDLGALHLSPSTAMSSHNLDKTRNRLKRAKVVQTILDSCKNKETDVAATSGSVDKENIIDTVNNLIRQKKELNDKLNTLDKEKSPIEPYGDFEPSIIKELSEKGIHIKLFHVRGKAPVVAPENTHLSVINQKSSGQ